MTRQATHIGRRKTATGKEAGCFSLVSLVAEQNWLTDKASNLHFYKGGSGGKKWNQKSEKKKYQLAEEIQSTIDFCS